MTISEALYHLENFDLTRNTPKDRALAEMRDRLRHIRSLSILDPGSKLTETAAKTILAEADRLDLRTFGANFHDLPAAPSAPWETA